MLKYFWPSYSGLSWIDLSMSCKVLVREVRRTYLFGLFIFIELNQQVCILVNDDSVVWEPLDALVI